jgi:uncharacterized membrane protein YphA (DoxX/SURF4 family)
MTRKTRSIAYWTTTLILSLDFALGGVTSILRPPQVIEGMQHLGYPAYLATLLGVWKLLGAIALVAPRNARLKEWAYAGIAFDLTGAAWSHAASGDGLKAIVPLVFLAIAIASYVLRPSSRSFAIAGRAAVAL